MKNMKVNNMTSPRTGKPVANQYIIRTPDGEYFQSYSSVIAFRANDGTVTLDENTWDYSVTTNKYRSAFLGENTAMTRKKISAGLYQLADLN